MAQIDIKEATVRIIEGGYGTATLNSVAADSDLDFTAKSRHIGSDKISVTLVDPATASAALSVVVTGREIVVNLATGTGATPPITSTAAEVKTAIDNDADAAALVTVALETAGTGTVDAHAKTTLDGQNGIAIKIGEGTLTYSEKRTVEFTRDRGILDTVREADEEPMDVTIDGTWEYITAESGSGTPTVEDALKNIGEASGWVSSADDQCQPFCVDVEIHNAPDCSGVQDEIIMFEEFYYETIDHDLREGTFSITGRCNRKTAVSRRAENANIEGLT